MIYDGICPIETDIDAFLLIGQSNMAGRGKIGEEPPIENVNCYMLRNGRWQYMCEPINPDRGSMAEFISGACLAASFADAYQKHTGRKIGLIPCADGGSKISWWQPGEVLFDHAVMQTALAQRSATLKGILWHQGESDCNDEDVKRYVPAFQNMIRAMREKFGAEVPVLIGELSRALPDTPRWGITKAHVDAMHENFRRIVCEVPNCALVSSEGLPLKEDGIHFTTASLRKFGDRYFSVYKEKFL